MNSDTGPPAWCRVRAGNASAPKMLLVAKLLFAISNNSSISTAFQFRLTALLIIPALDNTYVNLTIGTFESLRKISKLSTKTIVTNFGPQLIQLVNERQQELRHFEQFISFYEMCVTVAKQANAPNLEEWDASFNSLIIKENSSNLYINLQLLSKTNNIEAGTMEQTLNSDTPASTLSDPYFHRLVLGIAENVLSLSQFDNFNEILRFYLSMGKTAFSEKPSLISKSFCNLADVFFTSIKSKPESEIPYIDLLLVYDNLIEALVIIKDFKRLMYISNSLLSLGSRCKQTKAPRDTFLGYWRRSVSIELDLEDTAEKSSLLLKSERLCLTLTEMGKVEEAFEVILDTIGFYSSRNSTQDKVKVEPIEKIWGGSDIQRVLHLASRLLVDAYPKVPVAFSNLNPEVEASVLEYLSEILGRSSRANKPEVLGKIVERIQLILPWDQYPLRQLRVLHSIFRSTGMSYEELSAGNTEDLLAKILQGEYELDIGLAYSSASIISVASLSLVISSSVPSTKQFTYLNMSVQYMIEALNTRSCVPDSLIDDVQLLNYFLELQGAHDKRVELLRGVISSSSYKSQRNLFPSSFHLDLINSLLVLGFTGAAIRELDIVKKEILEVPLKPVDQVWLALRETNCHIAISDLTNAGLSFNKICMIIKSDELLKMPLLAGRSASENREHFQNRATLFAEICYTLAKLHIEEVSLIPHNCVFTNFFYREMSSTESAMHREPLNFYKGF